MDVEKNIALMERLRQEEKVIGVQLVGGIGDQIEGASMILGMYRLQNNKQPRIKMMAYGQAKEVVTKHLLNSKAGELILNTSDSSPIMVSMPMLRLWIEKKKEKIAMESLYELKERETKDQCLRIMVCWRTKKDKTNPLTSFSRTKPMLEIYKFMEENEKINRKEKITYYRIQ